MSKLKGEKVSGQRDGFFWNLGQRDVGWHLSGLIMHYAILVHIIHHRNSSVKRKNNNNTP